MALVDGCSVDIHGMLVVPVVRGGHLTEAVRELVLVVVLLPSCARCEVDGR